MSYKKNNILKIERDLHSEEDILPAAAYRFIQEINPLCSTILLGGSRARNDYHSCSDVDFLLICHDNDSKRRILAVLRRTIEMVGQERPLVDAKVFTITEFQQAIHSTKNLFLYTFLKECRLLHGVDIRSRVVLLPRFLKETVWEAIIRVETALNFIEQAVMWDVACHHLWTALATFFIANQVQKHQPIGRVAKTVLFQRIFGASYLKVRQCYEAIRWQMRRQEVSDRVTVRRRPATRTPKGLNAHQLRNIGQQIHKYGNKIYQSISR